MTLLFVVTLVYLGLSFIGGSRESDKVIFKLDSEARYKYMHDYEGTPRLVDLWMKTSDVEASARFSPETDNNYYLFTRANSTGELIPIGNVKALNASNFDPKKKTVVLVHGWLNTPVSPFNVHLTHAYLTAEDVNLVMTDWSRGAGCNYLVAILNCIKSGAHVAKFISWLNSVTGAEVTQYHVIGHSLGAHQVGIIGRILDKQLAYITALDPALPGWLINPYSFTPDVGTYTEVIHTDIAALGIVGAAGRVDFYPNGGWEMPGCGLDSTCNHARSVVYMVESLLSGGFTGTRCDTVLGAIFGVCDSPDTLMMGGAAAKTGSTGIYFLNTNAGPPYSQG